ncbi:MAG: flippase-like domain-containing protein, partial [Chloroflexi bacterium]|nr:flippase-like domain-containing protein [Chloroflexota bacterium]
MKRFAFISARVGPGLAASIGLGWLATRGLDWGAVADSIRSISLGYLVLSVLVFLFACYLRALRWQALFVNERISTNRLFIIQNAGIGLNNLVPIRIASEATQLAILYFRDRISGATALATLGMERVVDVVASTLILGIAFFLVPEMKNFTLYVWGAIGFTVVAVGAVRFLAWGSDSLALIRRIPAIASFARAVKELERERARLAVSLTMSILYWLLVGITTWIVAVALNLGISA